MIGTISKANTPHDLVRDWNQRYIQAEKEIEKLFDRARNQDHATNLQCVSCSEDLECPECRDKNSHHKDLSATSKRLDICDEGDHTPWPIGSSHSGSIATNHGGRLRRCENHSTDYYVCEMCQWQQPEQLVVDRRVYILAARQPMCEMCIIGKSEAQNDGRNCRCNLKWLCNQCRLQELTKLYWDIRKQEGAVSDVDAVLSLKYRK